MQLVKTFQNIDMYKKDNLIQLVDTVDKSFFWELFTLKNNEISKIINGERIIIEFEAKTCVSLKEYLEFKEYLLSYDDATTCLLDLYEQCNELVNNNILVPFFDLQDILVIDGRFYFIQSNKIITREEGPHFIYSVPFKKNNFISPEISSGSLPIKLTFASTLYSLGSLISYTLTNEEVTFQNKEKKLNFIYLTKLYSCLLRLLEKPLYQRIFLFG